MSNSQRTNVATRAAVTVLAGLVLGMGTQVLQGVLSGGWAVLANSGVVWALGAFALGHLLPTPRWAAIGGAIQLVVASCSYYLAVYWFEGERSGPKGAIIWSAAGIVAGAVFGLSGHLARRSARWRNSAWALVAGTLVGDGVRLVWVIGNPALRWAGFVELALAAGLTAWTSTTGERRWIGLGTLVAATVASLAASSVIDSAFMAG